MKIDMMVLGGVAGAEFPTTPATRASSTGVIMVAAITLTALCAVSGFQLFVHSRRFASLTCLPGGRCSCCAHDGVVHSVTLGTGMYTRVLGLVEHARAIVSSCSADCL